MTPRETLLAAAGRLEKLVEDATPGPWNVEYVGEINDKSAVIEGALSERYGRNNLHFGEDHSTAHYVATMNPLVAAGLAELFRGEANNAAYDEWSGYEYTRDDVLDLAQLVLGGE